MFPPRSFSVPGDRWRDSRTHTRTIQKYKLPIALLAILISITTQKDQCIDTGTQQLITASTDYSCKFCNINVLNDALSDSNEEFST